MQALICRMIVVLALLVPALSVLAPVAPAAAETPICQQSLPKPSSGALTLDRASVRPGETTIGIVSGLATWPVQLFGGSGETFEACLPGLAYARAEVMAHDNAAYFLVPTSSSLRPGSYRVGLLFFEGGGPLSGGRLVRFDAPLTVTANPSPVSGITPACQQTHPAATTGAVASSGRALIGTPTSAVLRGLDPRLVNGLNEYNHLDYIACLAGRATPITRLARSDSPFLVPVPADLAPGGHSLVIIGPGAGAIVRWRLVIIIMAPPTLRMSPNPAQAGSLLSVSGSCDHTQTISLISAAFDNGGQHDWDGINGVWRFDGTGSAGSFSGQVLLKSTASGTYSVGMRCGGGLARSARLTVAPALPATGGPVLPSLLTGGLSLLLGMVLIRVARRRQTR